ncbi:MAG TPA: hypothetical protein VER08_01385, partial [Pyrinomonadaceae bacterium]|nr:hypothetical protein [Pyrinomonadaceae bacterium]
MTRDLNEKSVDLGDTLRPKHGDGEAAHGVGHAQALRAHVEAVCARAPVTERAAARQVLEGFTRLLEYVQVIEDCLLKDAGLQRALTLFQLVRERAATLCRYVAEHALADAGLGRELREALDGVAYAVGHELRRVFEVEAPGLGSPERPRPTRAETTKAFYLLRNGFQQCVISVAQVYDPTLDGVRLFENHAVRLEESLALREQLSALLEQSRKSERGGGILSRLGLVNGVRRFREETMHFLMYKDWEEFERFADEILSTYEATEDLAPVLHRFVSYLEALLNHVQMRDVLRNKK